MLILRQNPCWLQTRDASFATCFFLPSGKNTTMHQQIHLQRPNNASIAKIIVLLCPYLMFLSDVMNNFHLTGIRITYYTIVGFFAVIVLWEIVCMCSYAHMCMRVCTCVHVHTHTQTLWGSSEQYNRLYPLIFTNKQSLNSYSTSTVDIIML